MYILLKCSYFTENDIIIWNPINELVTGFLYIIFRNKNNETGPSLTDTDDIITASSTDNIITSSSPVTTHLPVLSTSKSDLSLQ